MLRNPFQLLLINCILAICLLLAACQPGGSQPNGLPYVMATESFLGDIAQNVAGRRIKINTLLPVTVDPHEYQPKPQDVAKLAQAQVLIINGLGYKAWLQKTLDNLGRQHQVIVATNGLTSEPDLSGQPPKAIRTCGWTHLMRLIIFTKSKTA